MNPDAALELGLTIVAIFALTLAALSLRVISTYRKTVSQYAERIRELQGRVNDLEGRGVRHVYIEAGARDSSKSPVPTDFEWVHRGCRTGTID
jgi:type II secretory pathway component PulJ